MTLREFLSYHWAHNTAFLVSLIVLTPVQIVFAIVTLQMHLEIGEVSFWNFAKLIPLVCDAISAGILVYKQPKNNLRRFVFIGFIFSIIGTVLHFIIFISKVMSF